MKMSSLLCKQSSATETPEVDVIIIMYVEEQNFQSVLHKGLLLRLYLLVVAAAAPGPQTPVCVPHSVGGKEEAPFRHKSQVRPRSQPWSFPSSLVTLQRMPLVKGSFGDSGDRGTSPEGLCCFFRVGWGEGEGGVCSQANLQG